jgi:titin
MVLTWLRRRVRKALSLGRQARGRAPQKSAPLRLEALEERVALSTFLVTNSNDSGPGSLRQAILDADAGPGGDTIAFNVGGGGVQTIRPTSPLPALSQAVVLDATTQPGFSGSPLIVLNAGYFGNASGSGLLVTAANVTVRGLVVNSFTGAEIRLQGAGHDVIAGNFLGTDVTGTKAVPSSPVATDDGLFVQSSNNTIGGLTPADGNLISGNYFGLHLTGTVGVAAAGNVIEGNRIGTDVTGTAILDNYFGVNVEKGAHDNIIGGAAPGAGNLISGNRAFGIILSDDRSTGNLVQGNYIGTTADGSAALGKQLTGVYVGASNTTVGGTAPGAGNLISGNGSEGVYLSGVTGLVVQGNFIGTDATGTVAVANGYNGNGDGLIVSFGGSGIVIGGSAPGAGNVISGNHRYGVNLSNANGVTIQGNLIGTNATGTAALGNGMEGLFVASSSGNQIGGTASGAGNVISGNGGAGVFLLGFAANNNRVQGNLIGTDVTGTVPLGNALDGVDIEAGANNLIGGTVAGLGNVISANGGAGVSISATGAQFNQIQGNLIGTDVTGTQPLGNALDGVALLGVSDNTVGGTDPGAGNVIANNGQDGVRVSGGTRDAILSNAIFANANLGIALTNNGNNNQAAPALTSVTTDGSSTVIQGTLQSTPNTTFTIQFFADPSGSGQGMQLLGFVTVTTDASGFVSFAATLDQCVPPGEFVTATATNPGGDTSAFSAPVQVSGP